MWTQGWNIKSRLDDNVLPSEQARKSFLEASLTNLSWLQWYSKELDELNEEITTLLPLKVLGYMNCRDELIGTPLWAELPDEIKCWVLTVDDADIKLLTHAAIDGVMAEYDESVT